VNIGSYYIDSAAIMPWLEKAGIALAILVVTWILAKVVKWTFAKIVDKIPVLQRQSSNGESVGLSIGKIVALLIWLMGMIAVLQVFNLDGVIQPLQTLANTTFAVIPQIVGAGVVMFVGTIVGRIVGQIVETALATANADGWAAKAGLGNISGEEGASSGGLSKTVATVISAIVLILFAIAALQILGISSISVPVIAVLQTILSTLPKLLGAAILLGIAFFIARWVARLIEQVLPATGFDSGVKSLGFIPESTNPSKVVGSVVLTAIMLIMSVQATRMLDFAALSNMITAIVDLGGRVLFGSVIIAVGVGLARLISGMITSATGEAGFASTIVNYAVIGLFVAMGLNFMGIANNIVYMAFGAIIISAAVACALAFGLGGRPTAHKLLEEWTSNNAAPKAPAKPRAPRKPAE
jgi:Conserved TM helix